MNTVSLTSPARKVTAILSSAALVALSLVGLAAPAHAAAPAPTATILNPDELPQQWDGLVGKDTSFTVAFKNSGDAIGYGPYLDVYLPSAGDDGDDGLSFGSANYLGSPITPSQTVQCTGTPVQHPLTRQSVPCPTGQQLVILELPFGSFTPAQPEAEVTINAIVPRNMLTGVGQTITAKAGFQYGDSATGSTPIVGAEKTNIFTGQAVLFKKIYTGPEDETATGPNFPRTYTLSADVAEGFTVKNFTFTDVLPSGMQFLKVDQSSAGTTTQTPSVTTPGGTLTHTYGDLVGTANDVDASLEFSWYIPKNDASGAVILDPATGDDAPMTNDGSWSSTGVVPADPDDPELTGEKAQGNAQLNQYQSRYWPDNHQLHAQSIAVQKTANAFYVRPGQSVEFTIRTQVSDYFTVGAVTWQDFVPDGLEVTTAPTEATIVEQGAAPVTVPLTSTISTDSACSELVAGRQTMNLALPADTTLAGGRTGTPAGGTTIEFKYTAQVLDTYRCYNNASNISAADELVNVANVTANILDNTTLAVTDTESDGTREELEVNKPTVAKSVIARNGDRNLSGTPPEFRSGDDVTYRLLVSIPSGDLQNFSLTDYLPLPVYSLTSMTPVGQCTGQTLPDANTICYGPNDQMGNISTLPTPNVDTAGNSFTLNFGDVSNTANTNTLLDLIFTATIQDVPFVNGMYLTNQVGINYTNNADEPFDENAIAQVALMAPHLQLRKGVVRTSDENDPLMKFTGGPQGAGFSAAGTAGCPAAPTMTNTDFADGWPDADAVGLDVGETVRYAIAVRNKGNEFAHDVRISDTLPAGTSLPAGGLNLCVQDGQGNALSHTTSGFFTGTNTDGTGTITLTEDIGPDGATTHPENFIITYDVVIDQNAEVGETLVNTATIDHYTVPGRTANFAVLLKDNDRTDPASVQTKTVLVDKTITSTSHDHTTGSSLTIGETATYQVTFTMPEGSYKDVVIQDDLHPELGMVSFDSITFGSQLTGNSSPTPTFTPDGQKLYLYLGDITNNANDYDFDDEKIVITYTARLLNVPSAQEGKATQNTASMLWGTGKKAIGAQLSIVREPDLVTTKTVTPHVIDAGDVVTYVVEVSNPTIATGSDAFDVTVTDEIPAELTIVPSSLVMQQGSVTPTSGPTLSGNTITATFDRINKTQKVAFEFQATAPTNMVAPSSITNTASATWSSLPGDAPGERTGADGKTGLNNYVSDSQAIVTTYPGSIDKELVTTSHDHTSGAQITIGESASYTLTTTLPEGDLSTGFTITDNVPAGFAYVADSATVDSQGLNGTLGNLTLTATAGENGTDVTWQFGPSTVTADNDATNNSITLRLTLLALDVPTNTATPVTTLANTATIQIGDGPVVTSDIVSVTVVEPKVVLTKAAEPATVIPGTPTTFTVTATNSGNSDAFNVLLQDVLPNDFEASTITPKTTECGLTPEVNGANLSYSAGTITIGQTCTVTFAATVVSAPTNTTITNVVSGTHTSVPDTTTSRTYTAPDASATIGLITPDLKVTKNDNKTTLTPGEETTHTIVVSNTGTADADNVIVTDTLPPHVQVLGTTGSDVACVANTINDPGTRSFTIATLPAGATVNCVLILAVDAQLPAGTTTLTNTVTVTDPGATYTDPTPENNTDTDTNTVTAAPDLVVTKTDNVTQTTPGSTLTYTITITNVGNIAATNVALTDTLDDNLNYESCALSGAEITRECAHESGIITATLQELPAGGSATVTVTTTVAPVVPETVNTITNTVRVTDDGSNGTDPTPDNNTATDTDDLGNNPDMTISKTNNQDNVAKGETVTYDIIIANVGERAARDVVVTDTLPPGMQFVACSNNCTNSGQQVTWTNVTETDDTGPIVGAFDHQSTTTFTVQATVVGDNAQFVNTVRVDFDESTSPDPTPENNTATDTDGTFQGVATALNLIMDKTTLTSPVVPGEPVSYALTVTNAGPATVTNITVVDELATELTEPAYSPSTGTYDQNTGNWSGVNLTAGDSVTLTVTANLDPSKQGLLTNTASVTAPEGFFETDLTDNTDSVQDPVEPKVNTTLTKSIVGDLVAGKEATYILTLTNQGPSTLTGATISDRLPAGLDFVSAGGPGFSCNDTRCIYNGTLAPGQKAAVTLTARVVATEGAQITNQAVIEEVVGDPDKVIEPPLTPPAEVEVPVLSPVDITPQPTPTTPQPDPTDPPTNPTPTPTDPDILGPGGVGTPDGPQGGGTLTTPKTPSTLSNTGAWTIALVQLGTALICLGVLVLVVARYRRRFIQ